MGLFFLLLQQLMASTPSRIISLAPSLTKNLYLLEADKLLVGCTNYCNIQSGTQATVVANALEINIEKSILLKPDLVITTDLSNAGSIKTLEKLGIEVRVFKNPSSFDEICKQFIELGEMIDKKELALDIIEKARIRMENSLEKIPDEKKKELSVFMQIGAKPLFGVTPNSFMNDYIQLLGAKNILEGLTMGNINRESVIIRNPDVIIVVLMGLMGEEEKLYWEKYERLSASQNKRIFTIGADDACSPTPLSFVKTINDLIQLIYPEN
jgi:iron complex transport system substrate-binding protein